VCRQGQQDGQCHDVGQGVQRYRVPALALAAQTHEVTPEESLKIYRILSVVAQYTKNGDGMKAKIIDRCGICGKARGDHKSETLNCPIGSRTRAGYIQFSMRKHYTQHPDNILLEIWKPDNGKKMAKMGNMCKDGSAK
jgi:hypothetical protein